MINRPVHRLCEHQGFDFPPPTFASTNTNLSILSQFLEVVDKKKGYNIHILAHTYIRHLYDV